MTCILMRGKLPLLVIDPRVSTALASFPTLLLGIRKFLHDDSYAEWRAN